MWAFSSVLDFLFSRPILSTKQLAENAGMPFKTAKHCIEKLTQAGILREVTRNVRNRIYCTDEILTQWIMFKIKSSRNYSEIA